jgi:hypothetical protein
MIWRAPVCGHLDRDIVAAVPPLQAVCAEGYAEMVVPVLKGLI